MNYMLKHLDPFEYTATVITKILSWQSLKGVMINALGVIHSCSSCVTVKLHQIVTTILCIYSCIYSCHTAQSNFSSFLFPFTIHLHFS